MIDEQNERERQEAAGHLQVIADQFRDLSFRADLETWVVSPDDDMPFLAIEWEGTLDADRPGRALAWVRAQGLRRLSSARVLGSDRRREVFALEPTM